MSIPLVSTILVLASAKDCTPDGNYVGRVASDLNNVTCLAWKQFESRAPFKVNDALTGVYEDKETMNFCRNPDYDAKGPWCYIDREEMVKSYCPVPMCNVKTTNSKPFFISNNVAQGHGRFRRQTIDDPFDEGGSSSGGSGSGGDAGDEDPFGSGGSGGSGSGDSEPIIGARRRRSVGEPTWSVLGSSPVEPKLAVIGDVPEQDPSHDLICEIDAASDLSSLSCQWWRFLNSRSRFSVEARALDSFFPRSRSSTVPPRGYFDSLFRFFKSFGQSADAAIRHVRCSLSRRRCHVAYGGDEDKTDLSVFKMSAAKSRRFKQFLDRAYVLERVRGTATDDVEMMPDISRL